MYPSHVKYRVKNSGLCCRCLVLPMLGIGSSTKYSPACNCNCLPERKSWMSVAEHARYIVTPHGTSNAMVDMIGDWHKALLATPPQAA